MLVCLPFLCGASWIACLAVGAEARAADQSADVDLKTARADAAKTYQRQVEPFLSTYCAPCHNVKNHKADVTFSFPLKNPASPSLLRLWKRAAEQISTHVMPPDGAESPSLQERKVVLDWIASVRRLIPKDPGQFVIRRLSKTEYGNTLHDLFGVDPQIARDLPEEVLGAGYTNSLSPMQVEQYLSVANEVLDKILAPAGKPPTEVQRRLLGGEPAAGADGTAAASKIAERLARLAYRRPPSPDEIEVLLRVFALASEQGKSYPEALRLMLKAILVSPQFLFITPESAAQADGQAASGIVALDDYQLASRLSYFLCATTPDAQLSALADAGKLRDPAVLAAETRRLLADPRSRALFDGFGAQWLGVDKLADKTFDADKFPQMTVEMRTAMYDEVRLLFESIVRENRSLTTFIDGDYTFLNGLLAPLYGLEATVGGPEMRKVTLNDSNRGGILTMPAMLAITSFPNRTSPVNRGVWVLEQVLGEHVPPPPPNVPALEKQNKKKIANRTLRQRMELHRANAVCANCHRVLDPIGFGLENFDAIGRWRDRDESGGAIDAAGELPDGQTFRMPAQLKEIIAARRDDFCRNLTGKLLAYALCRRLEDYDEKVVDDLADLIAADDYRMQTLVVGVVTSYPFTYRRLTSPGEVPHAK